MAIWIIICGCALMLIAIFNDEFYPADMYGGSAPGGRLPNWLGKGLFGGIGALLVAAGVAMIAGK